jgi:hypothetical protein
VQGLNYKENKIMTSYLNKLLTLAVLAIALSGCATGSLQSLPAPDLEKVIDSDKAVIKLHRESSMIGMAYRWEMYDNQTHIGDIANDDYLVWERDANTVMCISLEKFLLEKTVFIVSTIIEEMLSKPDCYRVEGGKVNEFEYMFIGVDGKRLFRK